MNTIRVALPGYNALTETIIDRFSLYTDSDNILIKEKARGTGSVAHFSTATISHGLSYPPFFLVYSEVASGIYRIANGFDALGIDWQAYADTSNLYIVNNFSATYTHYRYYIFYDNITA